MPFFDSQGNFSNPFEQDVANLQASRDESIKNGESFDSWYSKNYGSSSSSLFNRIEDFFSGDISSMRNSYEQDLENFFNKNNYEIQAQLERDLRSTQYQDMVQSMRDAGINPYAILSNGFSGAGGSSSVPVQFGRAQKTESQARGMVALVYMVGRIAAAILTRGKSSAAGAGSKAVKYMSSNW